MDVSNYIISNYSYRRNAGAPRSQTKPVKLYNDNCMLINVMNSRKPIAYLMYRLSNVLKTSLPRSRKRPDSYILMILC